MNKVIASLLMIGVVAAMAGAGTFAYFSDTETSVSNSFTAGTLDLKTNDGDGVTDTFAMSNMVPGGDTTTGTVTLKNAGSVTADHVEITSVVNTPTENEVNEPECTIGYGGTWDGDTCTVTPDNGAGDQNDIDTQLVITAMTYDGATIPDRNDVDGDDDVTENVLDVTGADANANDHIDLDDLEAEIWTQEGGLLDNLPAPGAGKVFLMTVQLSGDADDCYQTDKNGIAITFALNQDAGQ